MSLPLAADLALSASAPAARGAAPPARAEGLLARPVVGRLSLSGRIVAVTAAIGVVVIVLSALLMVSHARTEIARAVAVDRDLARDYVIAAVGSLLRDNRPEDVAAFLAARIAQPRLVRITVDGRAGGVVRPAAPGAATGAAAPAWFRSLLAPAAADEVLPLQFGARRLGTVVIAADPFDDIDAAWASARMLAALAVVAYALTLLALWRVVERALRPLKTMAEGVDRLGTGDFTSRIGAVTVPDLAALAERFDRLGAALQRTMAEKDALTRTLVGVQDGERKAIARELHDEFGPCVFGLKVEARAILDEAETTGADVIAASARSLCAIVARMEHVNGDLLSRLRPMALDELPLARVLDDLVGTMRALAPSIAWQVTIDDALGRCDETTSLTIYRVLQEALTNALRHSAATAIAVVAGRHEARPGWADLVIRDNGIGAGPGLAAGAGIAGMRERVAGVGGRLAIGAAEGGGLRVRAEVPLVGRPEEER